MLCYQRYHPCYIIIYCFLDVVCHMLDIRAAQNEKLYCGTLIALFKRGQVHGATSVLLPIIRYSAIKQQPECHNLILLVIFGQG